MEETVHKLKNREKEIIDNLLRFRFLNRPQIQTMLNHRYKGMVIRWLNNLTKRGYIFRIYSKEFAGKPSIYCLDKGSVPYLKEKGVEKRIIKRFYKEITRSQTFRDRSLLIADIYLLLRKQAKKDKANLDFYAQMDLENIDHLPNNPPHAYFSIKGKNKRTKRYFLEIFDPQPPRFWMFERVSQYLEYFQSDEWQDNTDTKFPEVILVAPDEKSQRYLKKQVNEQSEDEEIPFRITTWEAINRSKCIIQKTV